MINQATTQSIKDTTDLKDLELLLCAILGKQFQYLDSCIRNLEKGYLQDEQDFNPESVSDYFIGEVKNLKELLEDFKRKAKEINPDRTNQLYEKYLQSKL
jgi:hypothetical protein